MAITYRCSGCGKQGATIKHPQERDVAYTCRECRGPDSGDRVPFVVNAPPGANTGKRYQGYKKKKEKSNPDDKLSRLLRRAKRSG